MNNKLIFLDWDGVLNNWGAVTKEQARADHESGAIIIGSFKQACKRESLANLEWLLAQTGAEIVISSSWRIMYPEPEVWERELRMLGVPSARVIGCTPVMDMQKRGEEIDAWLQENGDRPFVILDDCDNMEPHLRHLVQTKMHIGLTMDDAEMAAYRLNGRR